MSNAPVVSAAIGDQSSPEDAEWSYAFPADAFSDVDGDTLTYSATLGDGSALPSWLSFDPGTRTFSGTPPQDFNGDISLTVAASDGSASVSDTFVFTITPVEDEATGSASVSGDLEEGGTVTSSVTATDVDGEITGATYQWQISADGSTGWSDISGATSAIYVIASDQNEVGSHLRVVSVTTDALGGTTSFTSDATAAIANVNDAPAVANEIRNVTRAENQEFFFFIPENTFFDDDGDVLNYTATLADGSALPSWITFDPETLRFAGDTTGITEAEYEFTLTASDGVTSASNNFRFIVSDDLLDLRIDYTIDNNTQEILITFEIDLSDNFSNAVGLQILYWLAEPREGHQQWINVERVEGSNTFRATEVHPDTLASGAYEIRMINVVDDFGNQITFTQEELEYLGFSPRIEIENPLSDDIPPSLDVIQIGEPALVDGEWQIQVFVEASDQGSGLVREAVVEIVGPTGVSYQVRSEFDDSGQLLATFNFPEYTAAGVYRVNTVRIEDTSWNYNDNRGYLAENPDAQIVFDNPFADNVAPDLQSFEIWVEFDDDTNRPIIRIEASGIDANGIQDSYIRFTGPPGTSIYKDRYLNLEASEDGANISGSIALNTGFAPGQWSTGFFWITDAAGNRVNLDSSQLEGLGFAPYLNIYAPIDPTVGGIVTGSNSDDYVFGSNLTDDTLEGGAGNDILQSGDGDDVVDGGAGDDTIVGGSGRGDDAYFGGDGIDTIIYSSATAGITVDLTTGVATSSAGNDAASIGTDSLTGIENIIAGNYDDQLTGDDVANRIEGGAGDDVIRGLAGADALDGGAGIDTLSYEGSAQGVFVRLQGYGDLSNTQYAFGGDAAGDTLTGFENVIGSSNADDIIGSEGDNVLRAGVGNDSVRARGGNDTVIGGAGGDALDGGAGIDTLSYEGSSAGVFVRLQGYGDLSNTQYAFGGDAAGDTLTGFENVIGSSFNDDIIGSEGVNRLEGGAGNDNIRARGGNDVVRGGSGADTLDGGAGIDTLSYEGSAGGVVVRLQGFGSLSNTQYAFGGDAAGDTLTGFENVIGSSFNDDLIGSNGVNVISGGAGNDVIRGRAGGDALDGGAGIDTLSYEGSAGGVVVRLQGFGSLSNTQYAFGGDAAGDTLTGFENVIGSSFNDDIIGSNGANVIFGGAGNDVIRGRAGGDALDGGAGIDTLSYEGSSAGVFVRLQGYGDLSNSQYAFGGDAAGDTLTGFENVIGSSFADDIIGSEGVNRIEGGAGNDVIRGRGGSDTFVFKANSGQDTITDWQDGIDIIDLSSLGTSWATISTGLSQVGNDTIIDLGGGNTITLKNVALGAIDQGDFQFGSQTASASTRTSQQLATSSMMVAAVSGYYSLSSSSADAATTGGDLTTGSSTLGTFTYATEGYGQLGAMADQGTASFMHTAFQSMESFEAAGATSTGIRWMASGDGPDAALPGLQPAADPWDIVAGSVDAGLFDSTYDQGLTGPELISGLDLLASMVGDSTTGEVLHSLGSLAPETRAASSEAVKALNTEDNWQDIMNIVEIVDVAALLDGTSPNNDPIFEHTAQSTLTSNMLDNTLTGSFSNTIPISLDSESATLALDT